MTLQELLVCFNESKTIGENKEAVDMMRHYSREAQKITMQINTVFHEPEEARDFFVTYFGGKANDGYHNPKTNFRSYFITFDDGARLELMNKPGMDDPEKHLNRTGYAHIAFSVGSTEKVDR